MSVLRRGHCFALWVVGAAAMLCVLACGRADARGHSQQGPAVALHGYRYGDYASLERFIKTRSEKRRSLPAFRGYWAGQDHSALALQEPAQPVLRLSVPAAPFDRKNLIPAPLPEQRTVASDDLSVRPEALSATPKADASLVVTTETAAPAAQGTLGTASGLNQSNFLSSEDLMLFLKKPVPQAGDAHLALPFTLPRAAIAPVPPAPPSKATFIQR